MQRIISFFARGKNDFESLFFQREFIRLTGQTGQRIYTLVAMLTITFVALGYAIGGINHLQKKMNNPYTNWVNLEIKNNETAEAAKKIVAEVTEEQQAAYQIKEILPYSRFWLDFYSLETGIKGALDQLPRFRKVGRTVFPDEDLLAEVLSKRLNLPVVKAQIGNEIESNDAVVSGYDLIITAKMAKSLGITNFNQLERLPVKIADRLVLVNVFAVVAELPDFCDFLCLPPLYNVAAGKYDGSIRCGNRLLENTSTGNSYQYLSANGSTADWKIYWQQLTGFNAIETESIALDEQHHFYQHQIYFRPGRKPSLDSLAQLLHTHPNLTGVPLATLEATTNCNDISSPHYLAFNFDRLDQIKNFKNEMADTYDVSLELAQVEAKENFALVSRLTAFLATVLIGFGLIAILLFLRSLLQSHLSAVRPNLGTFKAFGLPDSFLTSSYVRITLSFLLLTTLTALVISSLLGGISNFSTDEPYFSFNVWFLLVVLILFLTTYIITRATVNRILLDTPGNLVYQR